MSSLISFVIGFLVGQGLALIAIIFAYLYDDYY